MNSPKLPSCSVWTK